MSQRRENLELVLVGWVDALRRGDLQLIERHLHPEVVWRGILPGLVCEDRQDVMENLRGAVRELPDVDAIELTADDQQVLLRAGSPDFTELAGEPLEGHVFNLFTIRDGLIVEMRDFTTREDAEQAMAAGRAIRDGSSEPRSRIPPQPVTALVPFTHVADVERSVDFYELLGFAVTSIHGGPERLDWAALKSGDARLMLARADDSVDPARQGVLFYLYTHDLQGLQEHLRAHGHRAGAIRDGTPGPDQEMRVRDPDGYVLMIAQT